MKKTQEKRSHTRLNTYHLAKYRVISEPAEVRPLVVSLKNIGGGGVCLRSEEAIPVSATIQLYINFPQLSQPIPSVARVVWLRKIKRLNIHEMGIKFLEIEEIFSKMIVNRVVLVKGISKRERGKL